MALELFTKKATEMAAKWYQRSVASELNKLGLQYEDIMISEYPATKEALELADPAVYQGRIRRLKRASDLCYKGKVLQDYAPDMPLDPFKFEIMHDIDKIKARDEEVQLLELHKK